MLIGQQTTVYNAECVDTSHRRERACRYSVDVGVLRRHHAVIHRIRHRQKSNRMARYGSPRRPTGLQTLLSIRSPALRTSAVLARRQIDTNVIASVVSVVRFVEKQLYQSVATACDHQVADLCHKTV